MDLDLDSSNGILIYPTAKTTIENSNKTCFSHEIFSFEKNEIADESQREIFKKEDVKQITEYESFPSFANSVKNTFSSITISDKFEEVKTDCHNLTILEKLKSFFIIFENDKKDLKAPKNIFTTIMNENDDVDKRKEKKKEEENENEKEKENGMENGIEIENENEKEIKKKKDDDNDDDDDNSEGNANDRGYVKDKDCNEDRNDDRNEILFPCYSDDFYQNNGNYGINVNKNSQIDRNKISEKNRIEYNKRILNLDKKQIDAISRFYAHYRIQEPYNENVIQSLPNSIEKYKFSLVLFLLASFSIIIVLTIIMTIWNAIIPETDDIPLVSADYIWSH